MKLSTHARKAMPKSEFAGPDRSYPIPDKSHAANAKARASQAVNAGRMSKGEEEKIDAKANRKLGESAKGKTERKPEKEAANKEGRARSGPKAEAREARPHMARPGAPDTISNDTHFDKIGR